MALFFLAAASLFLLFAKLSPVAHAATQGNRLHRRLRHQLTSGAAKGTHLSRRNTIVKVTDGKSEYDEDDDGEDDSGDDTEGDADDKQEEAAEEKAEAAQLTAKEKQQDDARKAEEAKLQLAVKTKREALSATVLKLTELHARKNHIENKPASDQEIDASVRAVANETESKAMAAMLGNMWKEMRMYEAPGYALYLEEQIEKLQAQQKEQEQELSSAEASLAAYQKGGPAPSSTAAPVRTVATTTLAVSLEPKFGEPKQWEPWWMKRKIQSLTGALVYVVFGIICAYIYSKFRSRKDFWIVQNLTYQEGRWSTPLFGCCRSLPMCFAGFFCPCMRWADTVDRAKTGMSFWPAFMVFFILVMLQPYFYGISGLVIIYLGVRSRQLMRSKYELPSGTRKSYVEDCLVWFCCSPCAIIQEAHEELARRT